MLTDYRLNDARAGSHCRGEDKEAEVREEEEAEVEEKEGAAREAGKQR